MQTDLRLTHIAFDLLLGDEGCHGVDDDQIHGTGADDLLGDVQCLLPVVGLRDIEAVHIYAKGFGIGGVEGVLCVNDNRLTALLLHLCDGVDGKRRLTRGFGAVDLDDAATRVAPHAEGVVEVDGACGDDIDIGRRASGHIHHRTLAVGLLDLAEDGLEGLQLGIVLRLLLFILGTLGELLFYFFTHRVVYYM